MWNLALNLKLENMIFFFKEIDIPILDCGVLANRTMVVTYIFHYNNTTVNNNTEHLFIVSLTVKVRMGTEMYEAPSDENLVRFKIYTVEYTGILLALQVKMILWLKFQLCLHVCVT